MDWILGTHTVTTAVSCLPVLVLGTGAALAHLLHADARTTAAAPGPGADRADRPTDTAARDHLAHADAARDHLAHADAAAQPLITAGQRVSRRTLRAAGVRGSNASLGTLARALAASHDAAGTAASPRPATGPDGRAGRASAIKSGNSCRRPMRTATRWPCQNRRASDTADNDIRPPPTVTRTTDMDDDLTAVISPARARLAGVRYSRPRAVYRE
jgi:hypothetical protein